MWIASGIQAPRSHKHTAEKRERRKKKEAFNGDLRSRQQPNQTLDSRIAEQLNAAAISGFV